MKRIDLIRHLERHGSNFFARAVITVCTSTEPPAISQQFLAIKICKDLEIPKP